jgi:hypothetical protein
VTGVSMPGCGLTSGAGNALDTQRTAQHAIFQHSMANSDECHSFCLLIALSHGVGHVRER